MPSLGSSASDQPVPDWDSAERQFRALAVLCAPLLPNCQFFFLAGLLRAFSELGSIVLSQRGLLGRFLD